MFLHHLLFLSITASLFKICLSNVFRGSVCFHFFPLRKCPLPQPSACDEFYGSECRIISESLFFISFVITTIKWELGKLKNVAVLLFSLLR